VNNKIEKVEERVASLLTQFTGLSKKKDTISDDKETALRIEEEGKPAIFDLPVNTPDLAQPEGPEKDEKESLKPRSIQGVIGAPLQGSNVSYEERQKMNKYEKHKFNSFIIANGSIQMFDYDYNVTKEIRGRKIRNMAQVDKNWLYTI